MYIVLIVLAFAGCTVFKGHDPKKEQISLYQISNMPVRPQNHDIGKTYIADYEVLKSYQLADSDRIKIDKILSADSMIIKDNHRSCEFLPSYALKWSSGKILLMSLSPCAKIQTIKSQGGAAPIDDIKEHSDLEKLVLKSASK
jgi:hypothetical protein